MFMDELVAQLLPYLEIFASGLGILTIGVFATLIFLLWRWRLALVGLLGVQLGVIGLVVKVHNLPVDWATIQMLTLGFCVLLLGLSAHQVRLQTVQRPGSWVLRTLTLVLLLVSWQIFNLRLPLPMLMPQVTQLFLWLGLCALLILSLGDAPFFTGVALLLWCIPIQAAIEIILPGHNLAVFIGMLQILITLACSYMILVEHTPAIQASSIPTDITFPAETVAPLPLPDRERVRLPDNRTPGSNNGRAAALPKDATGEIPLAARGSQ
jgi:hypothetical protein